MDVINTLLTFVLVVNLVFACAIYFYGKQKTIKVFYSLMVFVVFGWVLSMMMYRYSDQASSLFWCQILYIVASGTSTIFLLFSFVFPEDKLKINNLIKIFIPLENLILAVFIATPGLIISGVELRPGQEKLIIWGPYYFLYVLHILAFFGIAYLNLFNKIRNSIGEQKLKISLVYWGFFISGQIAFVTNLLMPWWGDTRLNWLGQIVTVFMLGFTAYAIVKHKLLEIKVVLTEIATAIVVLALLLQLYFSKDGNQLLANFLIFIIVSYGGYLLIRSVREEIKRREQLQELTMQLGQANAHLQELDKMKTEFVSLASHELLTPVSAIEGYLSMILDEKLVKVGDPKLQEYLDRIYRSSRRLARLIADMLNISRIEEGRLLVEKKEANLAELVGEVVDEIKFKAEEKKQEVAFNHQSMENCQTYADPEKVKEVIVNIVGNAIKYSQNPGTVTINIKQVPTAQIEETWNNIEASIKSRPLDDQEAIKSAVDAHLRELVGENQLLISVKDQGVGIPKEELPRLFKKFHRIGNYSTQESQGTGLGLYISRALVELNHGRIWADSEGEGKGSTFFFSLPELSSKPAIEALEAQVPQNKEQLKPLAHAALDKTGL